MTSIIRRRSRHAPPAWRVFEALVDELPSWWVSVEDEREPVVLAARRPTEVTWSSPWLRRRNDRVTLRLDMDGAGSELALAHLAEASLEVREASTLRHRWGEHLDQDLREWLDTGSPISAYRVSAYRIDVNDWSVLDELAEGQLWQVVENVCARVVLQGRFRPAPVEHVLEPGTLLWILGRRGTAIRCLAEGPATIEARLVGEDVLTKQWYAGYELIVPFAEFTRRLRQAD